MKYPALPFEFDKRKKLKLNDIVKMKELRMAGVVYQKIADKFNVTISTVYERLNPEKYVEKHKYTAQQNLKKYHEDLAYRAKAKASVTELRQRKRVIFPEIEKAQIQVVKNRFLRLRKKYEKNL